MDPETRQTIASLRASLIQALAQIDSLAGSLGDPDQAPREVRQLAPQIVAEPSTTASPVRYRLKTGEMT